MLLLIAAVILVALFVTVTYYETKVNKAASSESREVSFNVAKGTSTRTVAGKLKEEKVISNSTIFLIYSALHSAGHKIQAGQYLLNSNMSIPEIVTVLTGGKVVPTDRTITIIEGSTNKQIAQYLFERKITAQLSDFNQLLQTGNFDFKFNDLGKQFEYQGFLFPDTYKFSSDGTTKELIDKMLDNFENKVTDKMLADMQASNRDLKQILIIASIIEKEVGRNKQTLTAEDLSAMQKERELVASVFYNRLDINMALESDATVNYITGKADRSVSIADTKIKSPYNTYLNRGLPPMPISNPGLGSIKAAIYPASSDYLYFLNKPDGEAVYGRTLDEHNANKAKYLK